jgi:hypothetical protein
MIQEIIDELIVKLQDTNKELESLEAEIATKKWRLSDLELKQQHKNKLFTKQYSKCLELAELVNFDMYEFEELRQKYRCTKLMEE